MTTPLRVDGVDTSHWQTDDPNLAAAKTAGVRWWIHKTTEGATYADPEYARRRTLAAAGRIVWGGYHFAWPEAGDARTEARWYLRNAALKPGDFRPVLDLEINPQGLTRAQLTRWVGDWVDEVQRDLGCSPIIYTPYDLDDHFGCRLWAARYSPTNDTPRVPRPWDDFTIRQFSNGDLGVPNQVPGFGHVDLNSHRTPPSDLRAVTIPPDVPPVTTPIFRATTQNVQALPQLPTQQVQAIVTKTADRSGIIGWQEIQRDRYRDAVRALGPDWSHWMADEGGAPISWRNTWWKQLEAGAPLLHSGVPDICHERRINWVLLEHRATGLAVWVNNTHYVANAFGPPTRGHRKTRRRLWVEGNTRHRALAAKWAGIGYPLLGFGDFNQQNRRALVMGATIGGRKVTYHAPAFSIDQVWTVDGTSIRWEYADADDINHPAGDHLGRRLRGRLTHA